MTMCQAFSLTSPSTAAKTSISPLTTHQAPSSSPSTTTVCIGSRRHSRPTTTDSAPASPSSARTPPSTELAANALTILKTPFTSSWMPRKTASTTSVEPGHSTTASPRRTVRDPKPTSSPQWSAIRDSSGGIPALGPGLVLAWLISSPRGAAGR